jgi:hypothetical protein
MKTLLTTLYVLFIIIKINAQDTIKISDFKTIDNTNWKGTLTYTDYQSGELVSIDTKMQLKIEDDKIISNTQYIYEPKKNNRSQIKIKKNGTYFGNEKVLSFTYENGIQTLITTYQGKDNGKKADLYITRIITNSTYSVSKKVIYKNTKKELIRNTYTYTKID